MSRTIRIATRGSQLAIWQASEVANRLSEHGYRAEIITFKTTADKRQDVSLAAIGGKGLWVKELEEALARGEVDMAVHSLKDVPSILPEAFVLAGFLERADPRDAWVSVDGRSIDELRDGAVIGTSAPRRRAQIRALYPHLRVDDIRGNVDTRINKLRAGLYDGAILASAGLTRLGRQSEITSYFSIEQLLPACGQGIVAMETLRDNGEARAAAASINHTQTAKAADCERGVLQMFGRLLDCYSAVAVHATFDDAVTIRAFFGELDGDHSIRVRCSGNDATAVIDDVHRKLVDKGAMELIAPAAPREIS